jgi:hypothetical protein
MGLKQLFQRWSKGEDARAIGQVEEESQMTPHERDAGREDFEARKDDIAATRGPAGSAAEDAASDDLDS